MLYHILFLLALQNPTVEHGLRDIGYVAQLKRQHDTDRPGHPHIDPIFNALDVFIDKPEETIP